MRTRKTQSELNETRTSYVCSRCKIEKPISDFYSYTGKKQTQKHRYECKECSRKDNQEDRKKFPRYDWASNTIQHHKQKGFVFEFRTGELHDLATKTDTCPICGDLLDWSRKGKMNRKSPTIDRVNGDRTLRLDNILIMCYMCNSTKQERTMKEFVEYCKKIAEKFG